MQFVDLARLKKKGLLSWKLSTLLVTVSCLKLTLEEKLVMDVHSTVKEPELLYPVSRPVAYPKMTDINKLLKYSHLFTIRFTSVFKVMVQLLLRYRTNKALMKANPVCEY